MKLKSNKQFNCKALLYIILLTSTLVLSNFLANYSFDLAGYSILISMFTYPLTFFFANIITKKYGSFNTLLGIIVSVILQLLVFDGIVMFGELGLNILLLLGTITSFILAQLLNLYLYSKLLNKNNITYKKLILLYSLVIIFDGIIFITIINKGSYNDLGMVLLISNIIRVIVGVLLAIIDNKIKK